MFKWIGRILLALLVVILIAIASLMIFLQTNYARKLGSDIGLSFANEVLESTITVGKLEGNLFNHIILTDVSMTLDSVVIAQIPRVNIYYSPLNLLFKEIYVDSVIVENALLKPTTYADSTWNFTHLYVRSDSIVAPADSLPTKIKIDINCIHLRNVTIQSKNCYNTIPQQLDSVFIDGDFRWNADKWGLYINKLALNAHNPNLDIRALKFNLENQNDSLSLTDFSLRTTKNFVRLDGFYSTILSYGANLLSHEVDVDELLFLLPNIKLARKPQLSFNVNANNNRVVVNAASVMGKQSISVDLLLLRKADSISIAPTNMATIICSNFIPNHWGMPVDSSLVISGQVLLKSRAIISFSDTIFVTADMHLSKYKQFVLNECSVNGFFVKKEVGFSGHFNLPQGDLVAKGSLTDIGTNNTLELSGSFSQFELQKALSSFPFVSNFNGDFTASGFFPVSKPILISTNMRLAKSLVDKVKLDSAKISARYRNDSVLISSADLFAPLLEVNASGYSTISGSWGVAATAKGHINHVLAPYLDVVLPTGQVELTADASGVLAQLRGFVRAQVNDVKYDSVAVSKLFAESRFSYDRELKLDSMLLSVNEFSGYNLHFDTIVAHGSYGNQAIDASVTLVDSGIAKINISALTSFKSDITGKIDLLEITTPYASFYNSTNSIDFSYSKRNLGIQGLSIKDNRDPLFVLEANGKITLQGEENFLVKISSLDLAQLGNYNIFPKPLTGGLNCSVSLMGQSQAPVLQGLVSVESLHYNGFDIEKITTNFMAKSKLAHLDFKVVSSQKDSIQGQVDTPFTLEIDSSKMRFSWPGFLTGRSWSRNVDLGNISAKERQEAQFGGNLSFDVAFKGLYNALFFKGDALLVNGFYNDPKTGVNYKDILGKVSVDSNSISLDSLSISQKNGMLSAAGWAKFDSSFVGGRMTKADMHLTAKNFAVVQSKKAEVVVDANFNLKSERDFPTFSGDIRVVRSSFFVPAFLETDYSAESATLPLLVLAEKQVVTKDTISAVEPLKTDTLANVYFQKFMENLSGSIRLVMPKNTWLKTETSKIELNGELFIAKRNPYFELLGKIEVTRGQLVMYGRKFIITSGILEFQGGKKINPVLDITTDYVFRTRDNVRKTLTLKIANTLENPSITYLLDGRAISESDAYSYIIFGSALNELGSGNGGNVDVAGSMSTDMISKVVSNQLSQTLGETFNLDIIEMNSLNNMGNMGFTVGKYLTNDLFVTYQKGFGESVEGDASSDQLTLEYELNKNTFFRLQSGGAKTSGVDIILKFEK